VCEKKGEEGKESVGGDDELLIAPASPLWEKERKKGREGGNDPLSPTIEAILCEREEERNWKGGKGGRESSAGHVSSTSQRFSKGEDGDRRGREGVPQLDGFLDRLLGLEGRWKGKEGGCDPHALLDVVHDLSSDCRGKKKRKIWKEGGRGTWPWRCMTTKKKERGGGAAWSASKNNSFTCRECVCCHLRKRKNGER